MRRRLYLLRHAKSSWDDPALPDHERPLNDRGRRAAAAMAEHMREARVDPQLVLCSPARRTRETLERLEHALGEPAVRVEPALYGAGVGVLLEQLRGVDDGVASVLVIGHNPGMEDLAAHLTGAGERFPTAALATLGFEAASWRDLETAELEAFVRPRDL